MKKAIALIKPNTKDELRKVIKQVWDNYSMDSINNLVKSFFQRLQFVIMEKGNSIQEHLRRGISVLNAPVNIDHANLFFIHDVITNLSEEQPEIPVLQKTNEPFTHEEDQLIFKNFLIHGRNWKKIAQFITGRTDTSHISKRKQLQAFFFNNLNKKAVFSHLTGTCLNTLCCYRSTNE